MRVIFVKLGQIFYITGKIIIKMSAAHFPLFTFVCKIDKHMVIKCGIIHILKKYMNFNSGNALVTAQSKF